MARGAVIVANSDKELTPRQKKIMFLTLGLVCLAIIAITILMSPLK